jgi:hypothetical protein
MPPAGGRAGVDRADHGRARAAHGHRTSAGHDPDPAPTRCVS